MKKMTIIMSLIMFMGSAQANPTFSDRVSTFVANEIEDIKTYQKESWAGSKDQLARTWTQIKGLFVKQEDE